MTGPAMTRRPRQAGFTLLELLVAIVVFGFILAGMSQGVRYGLRATDRQARTMAENSELDSVDRALRRLIERIDPGSARDGPALRGTAGRMTFVSELPAANGLSDSLADFGLGVDGARRLVLRASPRRPGTPFGPSPPPLDSELVAGVDHIELSYWPRGRSPSWMNAWAINELPMLVRLRVVFPAGDSRHWPDIVVAPRREGVQNGAAG